MATLTEPNGSDDYKSDQSNSTSSRSMSWIQSLLAPTQLDDETRNQSHTGKGTHDDPYIVDFRPNDPQNPMNFSKGRKWTIALIQALSFFAVTFGSSVYSPSIPQVMEHFHISQEVAIIGLAIYVLGFAIGPILWAPMSEVYGRRLTFLISFTIYIAFSVAVPFSNNIGALLVLRFLASAFGSSAQTNPGGMIADMFRTEERGPVMGIFAMCPFLGPALGPIVGGFVSETKGWRWTLGINAILSGVVWIATTIVTKETYAPVILRHRAKALSKMSQSVYVSHIDSMRPPRTFSQEVSIALTRPWILLFREPVVLFTGLYISIIYATLYMFFPAISIVFGESRGWNQGVAELPFIAVAIGVFIAVFATGLDSKRYARKAVTAAAQGRAMEPEARLRNSMFGSIILPIGLFMFAWTTYPSIHWIAPVIGAAIFSCGIVMVFISLINYLIDSYTVYAASALAANTILRSFLATAFPLFTTQMYDALGDQWASSIPAFLTVGCLPFPFLFYKYGARIRSKCKYAAEAAKIFGMMQRRHVAENGEKSAVEEESA